MSTKENTLPFFSFTLFLSLTSFSSVVTVPDLKLVINDLSCWHLTSLINHTGSVIKRPILWYWVIRGKRGWRRRAERNTWRETVYVCMCMAQWPHTCQPKYDGDVGPLNAIWLQRCFNERGDVRPAGCSHRQCVTLEARLGIRWHGRGPQTPTHSPFHHHHPPLRPIWLSLFHTHILPSLHLLLMRVLIHPHSPGAKQKAIIKPPTTQKTKASCMVQNMHAVLALESQVCFDSYSPTRHWLNDIKTYFWVSTDTHVSVLLFRAALWMSEHILYECSWPCPKYDGDVGPAIWFQQASNNELSGVCVHLWEKV